MTENQLQYLNMIVFIVYSILVFASLSRSRTLHDHPFTKVDRAVHKRINQLRHRSYKTLFSKDQSDDRKKAEFDHLWDDLEISIKKFDFAPSVQELRNADHHEHSQRIRQTQKKWIDHVKFVLEEWTKYE